MKKDSYKTDVKFLIEKPQGNVFAFFPNERYDNSNPTLFTSYAHIGQHGSCCLQYANECKAATESEYTSLKLELESIDYNLKIVKACNEYDKLKENNMLLLEALREIIHFDLDCDLISVIEDVDTETGRELAHILHKARILTAKII